MNEFVYPEGVRRNADGYYHPEGGFVYDYEKIARETGYSVDWVKMYGVSYCRNNPRCSESKKEDFQAFYSGDLSSLDFSQVEGRTMTEFYKNAQVIDAEAKSLGKLTNISFGKNGEMLIQTDHNGVPTVIDHDGTVLHGFTKFPTILRHPLSRGPMDAPMEVVLYQRDGQWVVHSFNMQDGRLYSGGYHRYFDEALEDFASLVRRHREYNQTGTPWTYSPELIHGTKT